jgi:hypothetical protein
MRYLFAFRAPAQASGPALAVVSAVLHSVVDVLGGRAPARTREADGARDRAAVASCGRAIVVALSAKCATVVPSNVVPRRF